MVFASPRSFTATISTSASRRRTERKKLRPIRPNPLMPTRTLMQPPLKAMSPARRILAAARPVEISGRRALHPLRAPITLAGSGSALVRRRIQTPSGATVRSVVQSGGGGRPRSFPSGPLAPVAPRARASRCTRASRRCAAAFVAGGSQRRASSLQRERRVADAQARDLAQLRRQLVEPALALQPADRPELRVRSPARAHDVGVVGVGEAVGAGAGRCDDGLLAEAQRGVLRAEEGEEVGDRLRPLRVGDRVAAPLVDGEREPFGSGELGEEARRVGVRRAQLEVRVPRTARRAGGEEARRAGTRPGSRGGRRRAGAGAPAARGWRRERRPRSAPAERARRPRGGAGSASPARRRAAGTSGSRRARRRSAGARTPAARPARWPAPGGARCARRRAGGRSRHRARGPTAPPAGSRPCAARSPPARTATSSERRRPRARRPPAPGSRRL